MKKLREHLYSPKFWCYLSLIPTSAFIVTSLYWPAMLWGLVYSDFINPFILQQLSNPSHETINTTA